MNRILFRITLRVYFFLIAQKPQDFITSYNAYIFSSEDQQQKQSLHFSGPQTLGFFDGKLLVASAQAIYGIVPVPVEAQIEVLLNDNADI